MDARVRTTVVHLCAAVNKAGKGQRWFAHAQLRSALAGPVLGIALLSPQAPAGTAGAQCPPEPPAQEMTQAQAGAAGQDLTDLQETVSKTCQRTHTKA
jgi:hypothetical protein